MHPSSLDRRKMLLAGGAAGAGALAAVRGRLALAADPVTAAWRRTAPGDALPLPPGRGDTFVALQWNGPSRTGVALRWQADDGTWSGWVPAVADDHGDGGADAGTVVSGLLAVGRARAMEVRTPDGAAVQVLVVDAGPSPLATPAVPLPLPVALTGGTPLAAATPPPTVHPRALWGAGRPARGYRPAFAPLSKLIVHHSADGPDGGDSRPRLRAIQRFHIAGRGWSDIGYNFLVDADGRIWEGRYSREHGPGETPVGEDHQGRGVVGAHAANHNTGSVGVCLLGTHAARPPTPRAVGGLTAILAWKALRHGIDPHGWSWHGAPARRYPDLSGHRDTRATGCPGDAVHRRLPDLRTRVAATVASARRGVTGHWAVLGSGQVIEVGIAPRLEGVRHRLNRPVVAAAATPSGRGLWLLAEDGGVFPFGDAGGLGSAAGRWPGPAAGLAATPTGGGYWIAARDGRVAAYGDATPLGLLGAPAGQDVAGIAATRTGLGYWLAGRRGDVHAFGDAAPLGMLALRPAAAPVAAIAATPTGLGYWLITTTGAVAAFGDAAHHGDLPPGRAPAVSLLPTPSGQGYFIADRNGSMYAFGDAQYHFASTPPAPVAAVCLCAPR